MTVCSQGCADNQATDLRRIKHLGCRAICNDPTLKKSEYAVCILRHDFHVVLNE
jgi:hypothetical protein